MIKMRGILIRSGKKFIVLTITAIFISCFSFTGTANASPISPENIIKLTDEFRIKNGLSSLIINSKLTTAAQAKAEDMVLKNYWSHQTPDGKPFWHFADKQDYDWQYLGENLAADFRTSEGAFSAWMNSELHRKNILNENYQDIGIGVYQDVIVAVYGTENRRLNFLTKMSQFVSQFLVFL